MHLIQKILYSKRMNYVINPRVICPSSPRKLSVLTTPLLMLQFNGFFSPCITMRKPCSCSRASPISLMSWTKVNERMNCQEFDFFSHLQIFPIDLDGMKMFCIKTGILYQNFDFSHKTMMNKINKFITKFPIFDPLTSFGWPRRLSDFI